MPRLARKSILQAPRATKRAKKCINQEFNQGKGKCTRQARVREGDWERNSQGGRVATHTRILTDAHTYSGRQMLFLPQSFSSPSHFHLHVHAHHLLFPPTRTAWKLAALKTAIYLTKASAAGHCCCCSCFLNKLYTQFRHSRCLEIAVFVVAFLCCR